MASGFDNVSSDELDNSPEIESELKECIQHNEKLLESGFLSDFVIAVMNGNEEFKEIRVHKNILSRVEYFKRMFINNSFEENKSNRMEVKGIDFEVVYEMVRFIYTGKAQKYRVLAEQLLVAAERYGVEGLKKRSQTKLIQTLNIHNVAARLELAHTNHAKKLSISAMQFIKEFYEDVKETDKWKEIKRNATRNGELLYDFIDFLLSPEKRRKLN